MFFLLSGFLSYSTDTTKLYELAKKSTKKLIVFTFSLNLLYYILLFPLKGNLLDTWKDWLNLIFWGRSIMSTLWFMTDLATGWFLITLICKFGLERLLPFCIVVIPLQVILSGYLPYLGVTEFMGISIETYFHTVPYSLGYLSLGFVLSRWQGKATLTTAALVSGVLLFVATSFVENAIVGFPRGGAWEYLSTLPLVSCLLMLAIKYKDFGQGSWGELVGRKHSANIYYVHMLVIVYAEALLAHSTRSYGYYKLGFVYVFVLSLLLSCLYERTRELLQGRA